MGVSRKTAMTVLERFTRSNAQSALRGSHHLSTVDGLRGIAAFAVCWFHLTTFSLFQPVPWLKMSGQYGWLGVQVFFVISGFIIPYSLFRAQYTLVSYWRFLARRLVRLDPPYFATIAVVVGYQALVSRMHWHKGVAYHISWPQLLAHIGYVNAFVGLPWIVEVFWTLAIEFQYYISIGLVYRFVAKRNIRATLLLYVVVLVFSIFSHNNAFLPHHLPLFLIGIVIFRYRCLNTGITELALGSCYAIVLTVINNGYLPAMAGTFAEVSILFVTCTNPVLTFLGKISYSLYLTHAFISGIIIVQGARLLGFGPTAQLSLVIIALAVVLAFAYLLYALVERPSKALASRILYRKPPASAVERALSLRSMRSVAS